MNSRRAVTEVTGRSNGPASTRYAALLWTLTVLFALRVLGQAVQHWRPQPFLPPFDAFQGSSLGYPWLLTAQVIILALMILTCRRVNAGARYPSKRGARFLAWFGGIYLAVSVSRLVVGLLLPDVPHWFRAWIPALFHLVLASFVMVLALHDRRRSSSSIAN